MINQQQDIYVLCGASSGIAGALRSELLQQHRGTVICFSRQPKPALALELGAEATADTQLHWFNCDYSEASIAASGAQLKELLQQLQDQHQSARIRGVFIFNGVLHDDTHDKKIQPEKALRAVKRESLLSLFESNTIVPLLWLQQIIPLMDRRQPAVIAALSARVGSIEDNRLGGWYSYRASKAALNMLLKTTAIECSRSHPQLKLIAFHPGTTDTPLSKPFQKRLAEGQLFTPSFVAKQLLNITDNATAYRNIEYVDWDAKPIAW